MSNDISQAVEDLKPFAKLFAAISTITAAVEDADAVSELEATRRREVAKLDESILTKTEALANLRLTEDAVHASIETAKEQAEKLTSTAQEQATGIRAAADQAAADTVAAAQAEVAKLKKQADDLNATILSLNTAAATAQSEFNDIDGKLQAKREEIRAIAG